ITDKYRVPLIINDRVDIALASGADGVHIGQKDLPANVARRLIGPGKILGVSAANLGEAERAQKDGADYIGVGAMFKTGTKDDADLVTMDELRSILNKVSIPAVVIGGINNRTLPDFRGVKIAGISVVSAVISQKDITAAASELINLVKEQKNARV
ncbi:MAG: thiamine phosphate synthase, partial [Bacillota bacterium]|nr:thiamine phosphate synthase [Bacillota bacterium]